MVRSTSFRQLSVNFFSNCKTTGKPVFLKAPYTLTILEDLSSPKPVAFTTGVMTWGD